jgi:hypothetical protein
MQESHSGATGTLTLSGGKAIAITEWTFTMRNEGYSLSAWSGTFRIAHDATLPRWSAPLAAVALTDRQGRVWSGEVELDQPPYPSRATSTIHFGGTGDLNRDGVKYFGRSPR